MSTLLWSYVGWRRFPEELSSFEVRRFFTLSVSDRHALRRRFRRRARLGAALQLGFVRMAGSVLDAFDHVPREVLAHVGHQLSLPAPELATLRALYRRRSTLFEHQAWVCKYAGLRWPESDDLGAVTDVLISDSTVTLDRHRLARIAREALVQRGCLVPRTRDIDDCVRRAVQRVEVADREHLDAVVHSHCHERWLEGLLREVGPGPTTTLEWLRRPPRRRSTSTLREELRKLRTLIDLSPADERVGIPPERMRAYALRMRRRRPSKVRGIAEPRRSLEVASLLSVLAARQSDTVLRLIEMRIAEIWTWAHALAGPIPLRLDPDDIARELAAGVDDPGVSDSEYRARSRSLLGPWRAGARPSRPCRALQVRERLAADRRRIRSLLKNLISLQPQGRPHDPVVSALRELKTSYQDECTTLFAGATTPIGHAWNDLIRSSDRELAFRAYEAATLWAVRRSLRNGSLWLPHAEQYGGQHRMLLPVSNWTSSRDAFLGRRALPSAADTFIARTLDHVRAGLEAVASAAGTADLEIERGGRVILADDPNTTTERGDAELLRTRLYARVGRIQLPELLLAVDGETHFTWELLGRAPSAPEQLVPVYAAILAAAMALDGTDIAMMIPGVRLSAIRRAGYLLEDERALRRANDAVVSFLLAQPLSKQWGDGYEASSDLMSIDVSRHVWMARVDPKRRRHAVGTYTHVLDQWGIVYDQPLLLSTRQAGAAIEGAVRQSLTRLERLAVDTHGYTDFGMAVAKLLGFDLCPRLYSLRDRHLHVPRRFEVPRTIAGLVQRDVSLEPIRTGWDDLLRLVCTIEQGWRSATDVLERFGTAARGDRIYRAGHALGQLLRTVYLCDYFTLPEFRRSVHQVLDRGESVHALQRQICTQALPAKRGRRAEELIATSGALTLVTNCVMAWNTLRLQRAVDREATRTVPRFAVDALRPIGPVGHRHINFRGTYRFPVDRYASRLVQAVA